MILTTTHLSAIAGQPVNDNMASVLAGLQKAGVGMGLNKPHRLAHYLAQVAHESGGFRYDKEIWGPTAAQKRYEGRIDLGNTQKGDGYRYRGRGPIQITGRDNYRQFANWAQRMDPKAPDFEANPDAVNTDPWEGVGPIWYWSTRNLNQLADANDLTAITRRINGGTNGLADRQAKYVRAALVLSGYGPNEVKRFQADAGLKVDGIAGERTVAALHQLLRGKNLVKFAPAAPTTESDGTGILSAIAAWFNSIFGVKQ